MNHKEKAEFTVVTPSPERPYGDCYKASLDSAKELAQLKAELEGDPTNAPAELKQVYDRLGLSSDISIVHGDVLVPTGIDAGRTVTHAWVEVGDHVIETSNKQLIRTPVAISYEDFKTKVLRRYSIEEANMQLEKHAKYGPWHQM